MMEGTSDNSPESPGGRTDRQIAKHGGVRGGVQDVVCMTTDDNTSRRPDSEECQQSERRSMQGKP